MQNFPDLPDEVLKAEFPQIYMAKLQSEKDLRNSNQKTIFIDQDNDKLYLQEGNSNQSTKYNLINANRLIKRPDLIDNAHISADWLISNWGKLDDENIFDTTNKNWDEIRDYLQTVTRKINSIIDFINDIGPYLDQLAANKDMDLTQILTSANDKYYKKIELDSRLDTIQKQIDNLSNAVNYKPQPNSVFPPGFTGKKDIDINDTIHDQNVKNKVETLNDIDEKGE